MRVRRWLRWLVPAGVVLLLIATVGLAFGIEVSIPESSHGYSRWHVEMDPIAAGALAVVEIVILVLALRWARRR